MKIDVIDLYKKDYKAAYIVNNKDLRKRVILIHKDGVTRKGMLLARYIWEEHNGPIRDGLQIDHINNDKTDDRLENLQLLTQRENTRKYSSRRCRSITIMACPVCGNKFEFESRNISTHKTPCCSRRCGAIKGALTKKLVK